jgi:hypothetical protein
MRLLKKDTPFIWDERAKQYFDALKKSLVSTPLLKSPDYSRYYLLYITVSEETIGMVLVQEDDELHEHVIYYLSQSLTELLTRQKNSFGYRPRSPTFTTLYISLQNYCGCRR